MLLMLPLCVAKNIVCIHDISIDPCDVEIVHYYRRQSLLKYRNKMLSLKPTKLERGLCICSQLAIYHFFNLFTPIVFRTLISNNLNYLWSMLYKCKLGISLLPDTQNCGLSMRPECRDSFPRHRLQRKPLVSDPGMHVRIASLHSRRMRNPQFRVGGKIPMVGHT